MGQADRYTWRELYLMQDLYCAWTRVLVKWLYLEGMYCIPTATVDCGSEAAAKKAEAAWKKALGDDLWDIRCLGSDAIALHREAFELEEAQSYTEAIEGLRGATGRPGRVCVLTTIAPADFPEPLQRKVRKILGSGGDEDEDDEETVSSELSLALLRRWKEFPGSYPGGKFETSGKIVKGGLADLRVISHDGLRELDVTDLMEQALRYSLAFMEEHRIEEPTPWFSNNDISWKAPNERVARTIGEVIGKCQGSAESKGDVVKGRPGEIWSVVTWYKFARWGGVFHEYGDWRNAARIPELSGGAPAKGSFAGQVVCFTGKLDAMERDEAQGLVESLGGRSASRVSGEVTLVVATRAASTKRAKAEALGIPIIDEAEFLRRCRR